MQAKRKDWRTSVTWTFYGVSAQGFGVCYTGNGTRRIPPTVQLPGRAFDDCMRLYAFNRRQRGGY